MWVEPMGFSYGLVRSDSKSGVSRTRVYVRARRVSHLLVSMIRDRSKKDKKSAGAQRASDTRRRGFVNSENRKVLQGGVSPRGTSGNPLNSTDAHMCIRASPAFAHVCIKGAFLHTCA